MLYLYRKKTRRISAVLMDDSMVSESTMDKKYVPFTLGDQCIHGFYLLYRYKLYEESLVGLNGLMENWIRALGEVKPKKETEPTSGVEDTPTHTTTKRKSRKEVSGFIEAGIIDTYVFMLLGCSGCCRSCS